MHRLLIAISFLFPAIGMQAQASLKDAENHFAQEDYQKAIEVLDYLLEVSIPDRQEKARTYYLRAMSRLNIVEKDADQQLLQIAYDLNRAHIPNADWGEETRQLLDSLKQPIRQKAGEYFAQSQDSTKSASEQIRMAARSRPFYEALIMINPTHYEGYAGSGMAAEKMADPQNAVRYYQQCLQFYPPHKPAIPAPVIGEVVWRAAELLYKNLQEPTEALELIWQGEEIIEAEVNRCMFLPDSTAKPILAKFQEDLKQAGKIKREIERGAAPISEAEKQAFEQALIAAPDNLEIRLAFAERLIESDPKEAVRLYERAWEINPKDPRAALALGQYYDQLSQTNPSEATFGAAKIWLERALERMPGDEGILKQLIRICEALGDAEAKTNYTNQLD
ncbi:MAG: tetratricopeptide repeat protein [Bacteroidetes bacterium]|nr:tetratricopeptide repeat protein [Bacteroidota bacterium]